MKKKPRASTAAQDSDIDTMANKVWDEFVAESRKHTIYKFNPMEKDLFITGFKKGVKSIE